MGAKRLEEVERYKTVGALSDPAIRNIIELAADICEVPLASVQLIDEVTTWILSPGSLGFSQVDRCDSLCDITIKNKQTTIIRDLKLDLRTASNCFVSGDNGFRFYMGVPLFSREGEAVGTLCVVDNVPRELTEKQKASLERLALVTVQLLESHRHAKAQLDAELILEKERGFLAAVLDNLADGVVACNAEGKLTLFNRALKKFHGLDPNGNLEPAKWSDYYKLYHSDGKTPMQMKDVPLFRSFDGEQIRDVEMVIVHTTGVTRRLLASGTPLFSKDGQKLGAVCAMQDVTELKEKEQDLLDTNRALQAATDAKSEFLANMSHEIRTPLNGIMGMASLVLDTELTSDQRENLETMQFSADSLLTIVSDILDFSKIEAGMLEIEKIEFDLEAIVSGVYRTLGHAASGKGLALNKSMSGKTSQRFLGDPGRLRQVLMNLVNNSIKFTAQGEISTHIEAVEQADGKTRVRVSVKDTGVGISKEALGRLFKAFSQADSSTTRKFGGTGLGLSISKRLVELMGGEIGVESELGAGSTFWFELTYETVIAQRGSDSKSQGVNVFKSAGESRIKILLAEDNIVNRAIALQMLAKIGLSADTVSNGAEVLELFKI